MRECDPTVVVGVGVMGERSHGAVEIGIGDGDSLHSVPRPALLHFDDLSVPRELIGDLAHSRHTRVGELDRKVAVTVRHNPNVGCRRKTWVLRMNRLKDEILTPYNLGTNIHTFVISCFQIHQSTVLRLNTPSDFQFWIATRCSPESLRPRINF